MPKKAKAVKKVSDTVKKTVTIGGYGVEAYAERDANEFKRPDVFQYKTAFFANPINFNVEVKILKAEAVMVDKPDSPLYPWGIKMVISAKGARAANWMTDFENRIRIHRVNR